MTSNTEIICLNDFQKHHINNLFQLQKSISEGTIVVKHSIKHKNVTIASDKKASAVKTLLDLTNKFYSSIDNIDIHSKLVLYRTSSGTKENKETVEYYTKDDQVLLSLVYDHEDTLKLKIKIEKDEILISEFTQYSREIKEEINNSTRKTITEIDGTHRVYEDYILVIQKIHNLQNLKSQYPLIEPTVTD